MEIKYKKIIDLIPYENNTRTHSEEQINQIASSIREFGFTNPVLIDENDGIIAGHGRVMGANLLDMKEVPTITLSGLSEAQIKAYIIADNKIALNAGWDEELLQIELQSLDEMDFNYEDLGFNFNFELEEIDDDLFEEDNINDDDTIKLSVECNSETDKQQLKEELLSRGYKC
jgi:ParB-like chromosome segregation protein Spo0J